MNGKLRAATCSDRRDLPIPPEPVRVTRRYLDSASLISEISFLRDETGQGMEICLWGIGRAGWSVFHAQRPVFPDWTWSTGRVEGVRWFQVQLGRAMVGYICERVGSNPIHGGVFAASLQGWFLFVLFTNGIPFGTSCKGLFWVIMGRRPLNETFLKPRFTFHFIFCSLYLLANVFRLMGGGFQRGVWIWVE